MLEGATARDSWRPAGPALAALVAATSAAGTWLALGPGGYTVSGLIHEHLLTNAVDGVGIGAIAGLLVWLRPANRVGWLLMSCAAAEASAILATGWVLASFAVPLPGRTAVAWVGSWVWVPALVLPATVLPAVYPSGRAATRIARRIVGAGWLTSLCAAAGIAGLDGPYRSSAPGHALGHNPLSGGHGQVLFTTLLVAGGASALLLIVFTVGWMLRRLRYARSPEREQLAWLVVAVVPSLVAGATAPPALAFVVSMVVSLALPIGIVRHQLFDIKIVLRRGLVYGLLLGLAAVAYLAVATLVGRLTPSTTGPPMFGAAATALLVVPGHRWLTGAVGRLVYGDRDDPVRALGRVGRQLGSREVTDLDAVAGAVADALRSPRVELRGPTGVELGRWGTADDLPVQEVPLRHAGSEVGLLSIAWRSPADRFSRADLRLVETLAAPVAVALRATVLAQELAESQARIVAVRDTERRALRDDLHDGLGPALSGVALGIEAALKAGDEQGVKQILGVVHGEVSNLVGEVRAIISDLGPDGGVRGGLVTALRSHADTVSALTGLDVVVVAPGLPDLDPPVEVALHRIAAEALTNVVRHAAARRATVTLAATDDLVRLSVADDGRGLEGAAEGVGRASMRERARGVGGRLDIGAGQAGGTTVTAEVPRRVR